MPIRRLKTPMRAILFLLAIPAAAGSHLPEIPQTLHAFVLDRHSIGHAFALFRDRDASPQVQEIADVLFHAKTKELMAPASLHEYLRVRELAHMGSMQAALEHLRRVAEEISLSNEAELIPAGKNMMWEEHEAEARFQSHAHRESYHAVADRVIALVDVYKPFAGPMGQHVLEEQRLRAAQLVVDVERIAERLSPDDAENAAIAARALIQSAR